MGGFGLGRFSVRSFSGYARVFFCVVIVTLPAVVTEQKPLATDVHVDLLAASVAAHSAAPVEPTAALFDHRAPDHRVTTSATHHLTTVGAVGGETAAATGRAARPRALVVVAVVRRRFGVDEVRRAGTPRAGGDRRRLNRPGPVKRNQPGRSLKPRPRAALSYQRHLPHASTRTPAAFLVREVFANFWRCPNTKDVKIGQPYKLGFWGVPLSIRLLTTTESIV